MDLSIVIGLILIFLGFLILVTDVIDVFVTSLLWPLLEGSSEGKTVLFLVMLGVTCILTSLLVKNKSLHTKLYKTDNSYLRYLRWSIVLLLVMALFGLLIEFMIRLEFGVSFFTILTSMNPYTSTTSPMHSHVYKSVLGILTINFVPAHVNTGLSILKFVTPYAYIIIVFTPIIYILGLLAVAYMKGIHRVVGIITLNMALIGLFDGGLFSQPFLIGLFLLLILYFADGRIGIKYLVNPVVILGYILLLGIILEVGGSDVNYHTLTVVNQSEPVDMSQFNVVNTEVKGDNTIYTLNTTTPDSELIKEVFNLFQDKSDATFMSWNFYSYF